MNRIKRSSGWCCPVIIKGNMDGAPAGGNEGSCDEYKEVI